MRGFARSRRAFWAVAAPAPMRGIPRHVKGAKGGKRNEGGRVVALLLLLRIRISNNRKMALKRVCK
jgi:hypothetical protein